MATVPVFPSLGDALNALAPGASLEARRPVGGSDLNRVYRLTLSDGSEFFAKANASSLLPMFEAEAEGLAAMRATGTIGVTDVLAIGLEPAEFGQDSAFLLLRWLDAGSKCANFWETFAEELAAMHAADTSFVFAGKVGISAAGPAVPPTPRSSAVAVSGTPRYGFPIDNYIGSTPQVNTPKGSWVDFFRECRLHPQVRMAYDGGYLERSVMRQADSVMERLESLLPEPDHPSLLHGDLWGGNFMTGPDGKARYPFSAEAMEPYMRKLLDAGAAAIMPLAAPIGSNKGLSTREFIQILIDEIDLPIIVDAAAELPPKKNIRRYLDMGASFVVFSGGKELRGPQASGLILGTKEGIEACDLNCCPNYGIGRAMKVDKENICGLVKAVEIFAGKDYDRQMEIWEGYTHQLEKMLSSCAAIQICTGYPQEPGVQPACILRLFVKPLTMTAPELFERLTALNPSVYTFLYQDKVVLNPQCLEEDELQYVADAILSVVSERK